MASKKEASTPTAWRSSQLRKICERRHEYQPDHAASAAKLSQYRQFAPELAALAQGELS
jgi:hypothetical protein